MSAMSPKELVAALDRYVIGQSEAKRAVAVAIRNRWRRQQLPQAMRADVGPKNILMAGPTGVGKTEIARRLAQLVNAPFIKVEATKYTEVGYHGRDVESIIRDLLELAISMVHTEQTEVVRPQAEAAVEERLLDLLLPGDPSLGAAEDADAEERRRRTREKLRAQLRDGHMDERMVELRVEQKGPPVGMFAGTMGMDQLEPEMQQFLERLMPSQPKDRRVTIREARRLLFQQESDKLIDREKTTQMAIERTENNGIVFVDEVDKLCVSDGHARGPDVSRQGVQRDLLPIIEGCAISTRHGVVRTDHVLFIAAGAFHASKPSDLMPELQGRLPIRVELGDLGREDFIRILTEPDNALVKQHVALMLTEGVTLAVTQDAVEAMADAAATVNQSTENIGARRLYTIMEKVLADLSFDAPDQAGRSVTIDAAYVNERLAEIIKDRDLSKFIL
ncbi:MAG: ATP-dependent protease ATPase subunit HslU [Phycisphaerae bacterium]